MSCRCTYCHAVKKSADMIMCDGKPVCREGDCRLAFYAMTKPKRVNKNHEEYGDG